MSSLLSAELAATCNALGYFDVKSNKYYADDNTLETVKDLIRYLRRDDESHDIRRQLGETKVVQTDLIPLLKHYGEQSELFDVLLRLIVNLTTPALMLWNEEMPSERNARNFYLQIEEHLQSYKQFFTDETVWEALNRRLRKILETDFAERGDEYSLIIERILILIRNVLYVPANPNEFRPDNDASVHDQVLWALHQSGMLDLILYISSSVPEEAYYMHILEILSFMFREQSASELGRAALQRSETEKLRDEAELLDLRHRETRQKQEKIKLYNSVRHSQFGGTFVVKSMKSVGDNELIYHKPLTKLDALSFNAEKRKPRTPRVPIKGVTTERRSAFSIRLFLKEFCVEFLNASYNVLMQHVKYKLDRAKAQAHDESYYLWAMKFFMEFNRAYKFEVKLVSETMSTQSFYYVQKQTEKYYDMISSDKKKLRLWSRRLHLALLAYRELLFTMSVMDKSGDLAVRQASKVIKSNVFYVFEYRELLLTLLVMYDELKMSHTYLNDLIETQHIFLRMLEAYCGKDGEFITQKKKKRKPKRKSVPVPVAEKEVNLEREWDELAPQLSIVVEGSLETTTNVVPFDATSDIPIDEQKSEAMKNIQRTLRAGDLETAVGLLRAAREVWPENDCFGSNNMSSEEEFLAMRDIYFADLGVSEEKVKKSVPALIDEEDEEDEEEYYEDIEMSEIDFKFSDFEKRLANPKIVSACGIALRNFKKNSTLTNHCIVKLLHRIAWNCKMHVMVFQASIFCTFQEIFKAKDMPQHKELVKFAIFIVRKFIEIAEKNPLCYAEVFCWKSVKESVDIEEGYGTYMKSNQTNPALWTEENEEELKTLFLEHQQNNIEEDVIDWIGKNLIDSTRSRKSIIKKLKNMYLLTDYKPSKGPLKQPLHWSSEEETQLRELFEQYKSAMDPLSCIMDRLDVRRPKNRIVEKLLVMGLVQDKKELQKKRSKKASNSNANPQPDNDSFSSGSESENDRTMPKMSSIQQTKTNKQTSTAKKPKKKRSSRKNIPVSSAELAKLLIEMVETADMSNALEWIKECIDDLVDDLENDPDDDGEGVPIVPIMESAVSAMDNNDFLKLLQAFGFHEPSDEQETYWRIPAHLSLNTLKNLSNMIAKALEKTLIIADIAPDAIAEMSDDSARGDVFEENAEIEEETASEVNYSLYDRGNSDVVAPSTSNGTQLDSAETIIAGNVIKSNIPKDPVDRKKRRILPVFDSESEEDNQDNEKENDNLNQGNKEEENDFVENEISKRYRTLSDSEDERPKTKKSRVLDSDDES